MHWKATTVQQVIGVQCLSWMFQHVPISNVFRGRNTANVFPSMSTVRAYQPTPRPLSVHHAVPATRGKREKPTDRIGRPMCVYEACVSLRTSHAYNLKKKHVKKPYHSCCIPAAFWRQRVHILSKAWDPALFDKCRLESLSCPTQGSLCTHHH